MNNQHLPRCLQNLIWVLTVLLSVHVYAAPPVVIPPPLEPWQDWVLYEHPHIDCPFFHNSSQRFCHWPSKLSLNVADNQLTFSLQLELYADSYFTLPGNHEHWPEQVMAGSNRLAITDRNGTPVGYLAAGKHTVTGQINWQTIPRTLSIPESTGLIELSLNGESVAPLRFEQRNRLVLGEAPQNSAETPQNSLTVRVYRHLSDTIPMRLTTEVQLDVSGAEREQVIGQILPTGFTPRLFDSALPARIEADGQVRVQLKPGRWQMTLNSYSLAPPEQLGFTHTGEHWPDSEIWVFEAHSTHRTVLVEGAPSIDPAQTSLPDRWRHLPAYLLTGDTSLTLNEQHRAPNHFGDHQLQLEKTLWLDFEGGGFTVRDRITGTLNGDARLEVVAPFDLGSANLNGEPLLVTRLSADHQPGIELRQHQASITALGRMPRQLTLPVAGWQSDFSAVNTTLHLPPGWSLISASGADRVSGAWLDNWNLWNIFLVLIISVAIARAGSWPLGLLALLTLVLIFQREGAPLLLWLNLAACMALAGVIGERWRKHLHIYTLASFALLAVIFLPFAAEQARLGIYPQLEHPSIQVADAKRSRAESAEPQMMMDIQAPAYSEGEMVEEVVVSASRRSLQRLPEPLPSASPADSYSGGLSKLGSLKQTYAPNQQIQAGPAEQNWAWNRAHLSWSGPVKPEQHTRLLLVPPLLDRLGHALAVLFPLLLAALLWRQLRLPTPRLPGKARAAPITAALLLMLVMLPAEQVQADVIIDSDLLDDLRDRLTRDAQCLPHCAAIESVTLQVENDQLHMQLRVHAQQLIALPLPAERQQWQPHSVRLNDQPAVLSSAANGQLFVALPAGSHRLELQGSLGGLQRLNLPFGLPIHNLNTATDHWQVTGAPRSGYISQDLQLERSAGGDNAETETRLQPTEIPAFVYVRRRLTLGLEWTLETVVQRNAPARGGINLAVPLLPGESPLSGNVTDGKMTVSLAPDQSSFSWQSVLPITETFTLEAASADFPWVEQWRLNVAPVWHVQTSGSATVAGSGDNAWWQPRPGDTLSLDVSRPEATAGEELTITRVDLTQSNGERGQTVNLNFTIKTFQGGHYRFTLPDEAELTELVVDGRKQPLIKTEGEISIPVNPGEQHIAMVWRTATQVSTLMRTPSLDMQHHSGNISLTQTLPSKRWTLATGGPAMGPAVLIWGVLVIVLLVAIGLGRSRLTPLKTWEWILLGLGIVTLSGLILGIAALCFIALAKRGNCHPKCFGRYFNLAQVLLGIFSVVTLIIIVSAIPFGLLAEPTMMVTGNGSSAHFLNWYADHSDGTLPSGWVISLPLWAYRLAMLAWSLWLALALTRWLPWAWRQLGANGWWQGKQTEANKTSLDLDLPEEK